MLSKREGGGRLLPEWMVPEWISPEKKPPPSERTVISNDEVFALLEYAASNGIEKEKVKALSEAIHQKEPAFSDVATLYTDLTATTRPINGRTLLDSREEGWERLSGIATVTGVFFILAVGNHIVDNWVADMVEPDEGNILFWLNMKRYVWDYLTPFFWGALGACVYLMKNVQDLATELQYEHHRLQGWMTRILLGGIFGAIVLMIYDPSAATSEAIPLSSSAVGFLAGLGVKVVYGAFESTIEFLAKKFGVPQLRTADARPQSKGKREGEA